MNWLIASLLLLGAALALGFVWFERSQPSARVVALVATLAALAALGRVAFAPIPNVKPTTDIVLLTGYVLGGAPGFAVGAVAAIASNVFFGQGPWTPWQMAGWSLSGLLGAGVARVFGRELGRVPLALVCAFAGFLFGTIMNVSLWLTYSGGQRTATLWFYMTGSFPFDVAHALGNLVFCLAFGPLLVRSLARYRARSEVTWGPAPAAVAVLLALVLAATALPDSAQARERSTAAIESAGASARAGSPLRYLLRAQNRDGGFGYAPRQPSGQMTTGWAVIAIGAAGRRPRAAVRYMRANAARLRGDLGERSRTILALRAAGVNPGRLAGRNLVGEMVGGQERNGSFGGLVNTTSFAILALRAAGRPRNDRAIRRGVRFIVRSANRDGGFNFSGAGTSGADETGAALQALAAAGHRRSITARRSVRWLRRAQKLDGGYAAAGGAASNAQSTAFAVQGLLAAGVNPARVRKRGSRSPVAYLRTLIEPNGSIRYSRTDARTPVWVTAQALPALLGRPLPIAPRR